MRRIIPGLVACAACAGLVAPAVSAAPSAASATAPVEEPAASAPGDLPLTIHGGAWPTSHLQGVAIDRDAGFVYWSFTQILVKTDLGGNVIGTVTGLTGHLGDLDINPHDGRIYGSLEYKAEEAFYIAIFDVDGIDRMGMDAEEDGVMTTVHLDEVVADFTADMDGDGVFDGDTADTADHRYGSSGIDGVAFGPAFGEKGRKQHLVVAYGIYSNTDRIDNDNQVLLSYDVSRWRSYERPLDQEAPHRSGPDEHDGKYFVFTGNTTYGVQNLEYDEYTGDWLMAVYAGEKEQYPNYSFFRLDGATAPRTGLIRGQAEPETGQLLELEYEGIYDAASGTFGYEFHGNYGIQALGDGFYYVAEGNGVEEDGISKNDGDVYLYRWTGEAPTPFERVTTR